MTDRLHSRTKMLVVLLAACPIVLAGCGRKGPPLKPSEAAIQNAKANKQPAPDRPTPNSENPDKKFILDGLLD